MEIHAQCLENPRAETRLAFSVPHALIEVSISSRRWVTTYPIHRNSEDRTTSCGSRNIRGAEQTLGPLSWGSGGGLGPDGEQPASSSHTPVQLPGLHEKNRDFPARPGEVRPDPSQTREL
ncbi:mCG1033981 [Mus musculus]|nr:mCG1033981 [Mus musculus]